MLNKNLLVSKMVIKGVNQKQLADVLNLSENTISSRFTGKTSFNTDEIDTICNTLDINDNTIKAEIFLQNSPHFRDESITPC